MTRLCPKCRVNPQRRPMPGARVAFCSACYATTRRAHVVATTARRKALRADARAAQGPLRCPKCGINPPRYTLTTAGVVPMCVACVDARWRDRQPVAREPRVDDLSSAEIDRRFHLALQQIRRRV